MCARVCATGATLAPLGIGLAAARPFLRALQVAPQLPALRPQLTVLVLVAFDLGVQVFDGLLALHEQRITHKWG